MTSHPKALRTLLAAAALLFGCGEDDQPAGKPEAAATAAAAAPSSDSFDATGEPKDARIDIVLKGTEMLPRYINALPGQTLVFRNEDETAHRIKGDFGTPFASEKLEKGDTYELELENSEGGEGISFLCTIHRDTTKMAGQVMFKQ